MLKLGKDGEYKMERIKKCFKNNEKVERCLKKLEDYYNEEIIFLELYFSKRDWSTSPFLIRPANVEI